MMKGYHLPGVAVALIDDQDVVWQGSFGLADVLRLPMDPRELEIEFLLGDETGEGLMSIHLGYYAHEICPRYPDVVEPTAQWRELAGIWEVGHV